MTKDEKIDFLLEWSNKTHNKIVEMIEVINEVTNFLYEREGESIPSIKNPKKRTIN